MYPPELVKDKPEVRGYTRDNWERHRESHWEILNPREALWPDLVSPRAPNDGRVYRPKECRLVAK